ncbi:hypothetical protein MYX07_00385 [Patescibacteria group bacterium AH-259-L07]|nr:hypothetical protein [Patescibacteria group bacterium AH-259-L07]
MDKKSIAAALLLGAVTIGAINLNINIDSKKFWEKAIRGELYTTSFNQEQYKILKTDLIDQVNQKKTMTYQSYSLYLQMLNREIKKSRGWTIGNVDNKNLIPKLNSELEKSL